MKKILLFTLFMAFTATSFGQYRWEVSGGPTFSTLNMENFETSTGTGFYISAGYGYLMGVRAKTSFVFSLDLVQRSSEVEGLGDAKALQVGFNPKFRYLFGRGKDRFRAFVNVGPSFRLNTNFEVGELELDSNSYEQLVIGGVYGAGFSQMIGEMFDIFFEAGVMNDFTDNLKGRDDGGNNDGAIVFNTNSTKFFDIYARVGVRFRIYDARR